MCGNFVKRVCTVAWCLTGLAAIAYFSGRQAQPDHPDHVFGLIAADFLPKISHGLLGLFLAALLASVMSSCDSFMIASSGLFTKNIYKPLRPDESEKHYVLVARITSLVIVAGGVAFAYWLPGVVKGLEIFWKVSAMMGIAFWLGLFWRRTTVAGAWAGTLAGFGVLLFTGKIAFGEYVLWDFNAHLADKLPDFMVWDGKLYLPWQMVFYLSVGFIVNVLVSLFSKPVAKEKLDNFYALVRTPIKPGEQVAVPCTLPSDAVVGEKRSLFPNTNLEILIPSRSSVIGFLAGWGCVAAIIYSVYLIANA
jgi:Na+/proline symporter